MIVSVLVIAVLIGRAAYLQIYQGEYYAGLADGNRIRIVPAMARAGRSMTGMGNCSSRIVLDFLCRCCR